MRELKVHLYVTYLLRCYGYRCSVWEAGACIEEG